MAKKRFPSERLCDDCGLPISICNARAMFDDAVKRHGRDAVIAAILAAQPAHDQEGSQ